MNPLNFLTLRNFREQVLRAAKVVTDAPRAADEQLQDLTSVRLPPGLVRKENVKRYPGVRDVGKIDTIVGHVTDVRGGFGVQRWGPDGWQTWAKRLQGGDIPELDGEPLSLLEDIKTEFGTLSDDDLARTLALCSRYAQTPYHRITSRNLGEVENRPLEHKTWASNGGNIGVSCAVDCHHGEEVSAAVAEAGRNMLFMLHNDLLEQGGERPIRYTVHGQWRRSRWNDTHRRTHLAIFKPVILEMRRYGHDIYIDYEHHADGGRPLTTRDDPDAHFDETGRRVRTRNGDLL